MTRKLFSTGAWAAMLLASAGMVLPEIAMAAEQQRQSESRRGSERGADRSNRGSDRAAAQRSKRAERQTRQPRQNREMRSATRSARQSDWRDGVTRPQPSARNARSEQRRETRPTQQRDWREGVTRPRPSSTSVARDQRRDERAERGSRDGAWRNNDRRDRRYDNDRRRDNDRRYDNDRRDQRNNAWRNDRRSNDRYVRNDRRDYRDSRRWDRSSWRRDNRYDWRSYRNRHRSTYRLGRYYSPYRDYSYRRLNIGFFLGASFYGSRYWISNPWSYRLPAVYGPYRWVRYYDDVLLVNIYSGEVVDVIYDFFW